jgi:hypothetical protein
MDTADIVNPDTQVLFLSWWLSALTWRDSGMNVGYWTFLDEKWFSDRCDKILRGKEQPKTVSQWRSTIRHHKVDMSYNSLSETKLNRCFADWRTGGFFRQRHSF